MNLSEASSLARSLMNKHGLGHVPFEFDRGKRRIGCTHFTVNRLTREESLTKITLSSFWTQAMESSEIRDTILHEIAHAKAGHAAGHGVHWRMVARTLGADPSPCKTPDAVAKEKMSAIAPALWVGTCPNGHTTDMHRAPLRIRSCGKCSRSFQVQFLIRDWAKGGRKVSISEMPAKYRMEISKY